MFGRTKKHVLWFPLLFISVTLILALTLTFIEVHRGDRAEEIDSALQRAPLVPAITSEAYQIDVRDRLIPVWPALEGEAVEELTAIRDGFVAMRVAAGEREVHIRLVAALNQLIRGQADPAAFADAQIRFAELQATFLWLR